MSASFREEIGRGRSGGRGELTHAKKWARKARFDGIRAEGRGVPAASFDAVTAHKMRAGARGEGMGEKSRARALEKNRGAGGEEGIVGAGFGSPVRCRERGERVGGLEERDDKWARPVSG